jgi:NAD(P)-dependent dehydrogenase (short-subunit alcohol dehydrogenase family)
MTTGLADAGMDVWVTGRTAARIEALAAEIGGHALAGDVSREDDVAGWFEHASPVDLLVNNAGVQGPTVTFDQEEPASWWQVFEINVRGVFLCCRAAVPRMLARGGGRIVNVTSGAAYLPPGGFPSTAHGPSKAAVHGFSELLAAQLAPRGVFVFSISPGLVRTAMTESHFGDDRDDQARPFQSGLRGVRTPRDTRESGQASLTQESRPAPRPELVLGDRVRDRALSGRSRLRR